MPLNCYAYITRLWQLFETATHTYGSTNLIHNLLGHASVCPGPLTMLGISDMIARSRIRLSWATHYVGDLRYNCSVTCPSVLGHSLCWGSQVWLLGHVSVCPGPLTMLVISGMIARSRVCLSWATHYVGDLRYDCSVGCLSVLGHSLCWGSQV